jgi:hypothetical protein
MIHASRGNLCTIHPVILNLRRIPRKAGHQDPFAALRVTQCALCRSSLAPGKRKAAPLLECGLCAKECRDY